jgi:hypothetical protein
MGFGSPVSVSCPYRKNSTGLYGYSIRQSHLQTNTQRERERELKNGFADSVIVVVTLGFLWRRETDFHSFSFAHIPCRFNNKELGVLECWEPPHLCFWAASLLLYPLLLFFFVLSLLSFFVFR